MAVGGICLFRMVPALTLPSSSLCAVLVLLLFWLPRLPSLLYCYDDDIGLVRGVDSMLS